MDYPWTKAPAWATYAATNASGDAHWYEHEPSVFMGIGWDGPGRIVALPGKLPADGWQDSLQPRP